MKQTIRIFSVLAIAALLFVSCQNPTGGDGKNDSSNLSTVKKEWTVTFSENIPSMNGSIWYTVSGSIPEPKKVEEGTYITLPAFEGYLTKYVGSDMEGEYLFEKWNSAENGTGDSFLAGASYQVKRDTTLYAIYSSTKKESNENNAPEGDYLDLSTFAGTEYKMKIGDKIQLYVENQDKYTIIDGSEVVSIGSDNIMEAIGAGTATVQVSIKNSIQTYSIAVKVETDTTNSTLDSALVGKWVDGESYLQFNQDGTGYLYFKDGSLNSLDSSCTWTTTTAGGKKWIAISDAPSSTNGSYEYTVSNTTLRLSGRLAFGMASSSTWNKE